MREKIKFMRTGMFIFLNLLFMLCCFCLNVYAKEDIKINNTTLSFNKLIYTNSTSGNDTSGDGTAQKPYKTLQKAVSLASSGDAVLLKGTFDVGKGYSFKSGISFIGDEINTRILVTDSWYSNSSFYRLVFDLAYRDETWTIAGTVNLYNVVIKNQSSSNGTIELFNTYTGNMCNCLVANGNWNTLYWGSINGNFKNNAIGKSLNWSPFTLWGVSYDSSYQITSAGWKNTGTGTNPDGKRANIGVYGGEFAWGWVPPNNPPVLGSIGDKAADEGKSLEFTVSATDPDGDTITLLANGLPSGAIFDPATKTFSWTPDYTQSGSYTVKFMVSDGNLTASKDVLITVNNIEAWLTKQNMPTIRSSTASVAVNSSLYVIGGINIAGSLNTMEQYHPSTNTWDAKANMPTARHGAGAAVVDGKIYVIGGKSGLSVVKVVEEYDPTLNTWTTKSAMPTARFDLSTVAVNGKIYAIGGYTGSRYLNAVEEYDPATDTWTTKASMPTKKATLGADVINGKIYAVGGCNGTYLNTTEEYDPLTNTWTPKANMLTARRGAGATAVNGKIFVAGGYNGSHLNVLEEYDAIANTWTVKKNIPTARGWTGTAALNDKIYMAGGNSSKENYLDIFEMYAP